MYIIYRCSVWVFKRATIFPYGLKEHLGDDFIKEGYHVLVGSKFPALLRISTRMSQGYFHKLSSSFSPDPYLNEFKCYF